FLAHAVRLLVGVPQFRPHREIVRIIVHEAARDQVRNVLFWTAAEPEELAAYLVLREFAGQAKLQNPTTQLSGLQLFSPELPLSKMEAVAPQVITAIKKQPQIWAAVTQCAESFVTPRRADRVL